jgi:hypothetical protein
MVPVPVTKHFTSMRLDLFASDKNVTRAVAEINSSSI